MGSRRRPVVSVQGVAQTAQNTLVDEVAGWPGIELAEGRFGSTRFMVGRRELGHLHGTTVLDMPLPKPLKAELIASGEAIQHRWTPPESGWVTIELSDEAAVTRAIELLRERYEHASALRDSRERAAQ
jgi:hypothetical protein